MRCSLLLACALAVTSLGGRSNAQTLYASTAAGGPGELYILDKATGAMLQDVGPLNDAAGRNYGVTGLAFSPWTGVLYGSVGNADAAVGAQLITIDPVTAQVSVVGPFNAGNPGSRPATMADIGFDPTTGILYGIGSVGGPQLYSINTSTGQATLIGGTGLTSTSGGGLAFSPAGQAFGTPTSSRFGAYDKTTGAYTNIGNPFRPVGGAYGSLDFDGAVLYGINLGSGTPPPTHLVTIDPLTAAVTDIGPSLERLDAIAFRPKTLIPEPGTLSLLLGPGALALLRRARRRK
jgi:hypothetical protein